MKDLVSISKDNEIAELREKVAKLESSLHHALGELGRDCARLARIKRGLSMLLDEDY